MDNKNLAELLKNHYTTNQLPGERVKEILGECEIARAAHRWKTRALATSSLAAAALIALCIVVIGQKPDDSIGQPFVETPKSEEVEKSENNKLLVVMIHSKECPNSQAMDPVFVGLQETFIDESVLFIKFDYSSDCAKHQAELLSKNLGLESIFEQYKRTGDIVLVSSSGEVRDVVNRGVNIAAATTAVRQNLGEFEY